VLVAVLGAGYLLLLKDSDAGQGAGDTSSFHFTATVDIRHDDDAGDPPVDRIEAWYEPGRGARWDLRYADPALAWMSTEMFLDGKTWTVYDGKTNTYTRYQAPPGAERYPGTMPASAVMLGPLPVPDLDAFVLVLGGGPDGSSEIIGEEEMLGRRVQVIRFTSGLNESRFWIDSEHNFILRHQSGNSDQGLDAQVQSIEFDVHVDDALLRFEPPANARELPPSLSQPTRRSGSSGTLGSSRVTVPEGFLQPAYIPTGYVTKGEGGTSDSSGRTNSHRLSLAADRAAEATLFINQQHRAGGLPGPIAQAEVVQVNGQPAYRNAKGTEETLTFSVDDVIVTLKTTSLPPSELVRIAESMR
jgi:outer membrane lipoprotein-sorting protein